MLGEGAFTVSVASYPTTVGDGKSDKHATDEYRLISTLVAIRDRFQAT